MSSQEIRWVDIVLESYVVKAKLIKLLAKKAEAEGLDVGADSFQIQVSASSSTSPGSVLFY